MLLTLGTLVSQRGTVAWTSGKSSDKFNLSKPYITQLFPALFQIEKEFCRLTFLCLYFGAGLSLHSCWLEFHHPCDVTIRIHKHTLAEIQWEQIGFYSTVIHTLSVMGTTNIDHCPNLSPELIFFHILHRKTDFSAVVVHFRAFVAVMHSAVKPIVTSV